jgi:cytochrome P450
VDINRQAVSAGQREHIELPALTGWTALRMLIGLRYSPIDTLVRLTSQFGDAFQLHLGAMHLVILSKPEDVQIVLDDTQRYARIITPALKTFLRGSLLVAKTEYWQSRRSLDAHAFDWSCSGDVATEMLSIARSVVVSWQEHTGDGRGIEMVGELRRLAALMMAHGLLRISMDEKSLVAAMQHVGKAEEIINQAGTKWIRWPRWSRWMERHRAQRINKSIDDVLFRPIRGKYRSAYVEDNFISQLARYKGKLGERLSIRSARDVVANLTAGERAVAIAVAWALHYLALYPHIQNALRGAIADLAQDGELRFEHLQRLPLLDQVISETLRLRPPTWRFYRVCKQDSQVHGYRLAKGAVILISPFLVHRHPAHWPWAEKFDPARFGLDAPDSGMAAAAYMPFGYGNRACMGARLAILQIKIIVATALQHYRFDPLSDRPVHMRARFYLDPSRGLHLRIRRAVD